jgi:hypothetical protein
MSRRRRRRGGPAGGRRPRRGGPAGPRSARRGGHRRGRGGRRGRGSPPGSPVPEQSDEPTSHEPATVTRPAPVARTPTAPFASARAWTAFRCPRVLPLAAMATPPGRGRRPPGRGLVATAHLAEGGRVVTDGHQALPGALAAEAEDETLGESGVGPRRPATPAERGVPAPGVPDGARPIPHRRVPAGSPLIALARLPAPGTGVRSRRRCTRHGCPFYPGGGGASTRSTDDATFGTPRAPPSRARRGGAARHRAGRAAGRGVAGCRRARTSTAVRSVRPGRLAGAPTPG